MMAIKQLDRLKRLDTLIHQGKTGAPDELARRLDLSRSQLYNILDELKDLGAPIEYDRSARSFYYRDTFRIVTVAYVEFITPQGAERIYGGKFVKNIERPRQLDGTTRYL
ncbi:MAG: HTH domain-containing protein [Haliscomenobacter sp.]|nr:HTH domain-containing protein [Haliscomenobacter sp.]MBK9491342.1 HTH domain-containing protein [Haliscomenobacter sp.]